MKVLEVMKKKQFMDGIKIMVAKETTNAIDSLDKGKSPMSKEVKEKIVRHFIKA